MNLEARQAPAIRARRKAHRSEADDACAIALAAWMWARVPVPIPVFDGARYLGIVGGDPRGEATFAPALHAMPIPETYDQHMIVNAARQQHTFSWWKRSGGGVAGNWYSMWPSTGDPGAGAYGGTARVGKRPTRTTAGAMRAGVSIGSLDKHLRRTPTMFSSASISGRGFVIVDRAWAADSCSMSASSQNMDNTIAANRYVGSASERGLQIFGVADAVHNATASNLTAMGYTNVAGTGSRLVSTSPALAKIVSLAAPTSDNGARQLFQSQGASTRGAPSPFLNLQAGDHGVQTIDNFQWSAAPTGTCCWELVQPIAIQLDMIFANIMCDYEWLFGHEAMRKLKIYSDACLYPIAWVGGAVDGIMQGTVSVGWM